MSSYLYGKSKAKRMTLFDRTKPEVKKAIAAFGVSYPNLAVNVIEHLKATNGVTFLPYGIVLDLDSMIREAKLNLNSNNPWDWFETN